MNKLIASVLEAVGRVPTIQLNRIHPICQKQKLFLKLESCNPSGSIKEKNAIYLIEYGEQHGFINSDTTIIEATSGNFGIGLAMVCAYKNYKLILVVDAKTPSDAKKMMQAYGAHLIDVPLSEADAAGSMQKARMQKAEELNQSIKNSWYPCQHTHPANPNAHTLYTAQEIINDFGKAPDTIILGVSTSGQLTGIGKYFRKHHPETKIIGVDVAGSVIFGTPAHPHKMSGVGLSFVPPQFSYEYLDLAYSITDQIGFSVCRELATKEGLLLGGSTGAIVAVGLSYAAQLQTEESVLMINPDRGDRYLNTIFNDEWLLSNNIELLKDTHLINEINNLNPVYTKKSQNKGHSYAANPISKNDYTLERVYSSFDQ